MTAAAKKPPVTAADLRRLLRQRFAPPTWAFFEEVHNGTGSAKTRSADGVAMALWPSRGLEIHGCEIKVQRRDWLKERNEPQKADAVGAYCDRFWLVVSDESVATVGELPPRWGLLAPRGKVLVPLREAEQLQPLPLERSFVAALLRRAHEQLKNSIPKADLQAELHARYDAGVEHGKQQAERNLDDATFQRLKASVEDFQKASGLQIDTYNGRRLGEAVEVVLSVGLAGHRQSLKWAVDAMQRHLQSAEKDLAELDAKLARGGL